MDNTKESIHLLALLDIPRKLPPVRLRKLTP